MATMCNRKRMRNLKDIFKLYESDGVSFHLDIANESVMDGDMGSACNHLRSLLFEEFQAIGSDALPKTLCRFISIPNLKCEIDENQVIQDIKNNRVTLSNPYNFNDPMDPILNVWIKINKEKEKDVIQKDCFKLLERALKDVRMCCLSEVVGNNARFKPLMWSHYGDKHKGICIKYRIDNETIATHNDGDHVMLLKKVPYRENKIMSDCITLENALSAKASCWSYENEYRLIYYSKNSLELKGIDGKSKDFIAIPGFDLVSVTLGCCISKEHKDAVMRAAEINDVPVYQAKFRDDDITEIMEYPLERQSNIMRVKR